MSVLRKAGRAAARAANQAPRQSGWPCLVVVCAAITKYAWAAWMTFEALR